MIKPVLNYSLDSDNNLTGIVDGFVLPKYTILVGKNNSGKSYLLKEICNKIEPSDGVPLKATYISPERFGELKREANLEEFNINSRGQGDRGRLKNQSENFILDSMSAFNGLLTQINRGEPRTRDPQRAKILSYLNNKITGIEFKYSTESDTTPYNILINGKAPDPKVNKFSSGTNQIIALMMNIIYFIYSEKYTINAYLLIDEPDVHIHADLQIQFVEFLREILKVTNHSVIIATHSSSIISGFKGESECFIATKGTTGLNFESLSRQLTHLLPSMGSHSLSHVFNQSPLLLVEGESDEMIWQYAIRKSQGGINFHIAEVGGTGGFALYEELINRIGTALFDLPKAYEIRDRDLDTNGILNVGNIGNSGIVQRSLLNCNEMENLILSNEVLNKLGIKDFEEAVELLKGNKDFSNLDRYSIDLKDKVYKLIPLLNADNNKSFEVLVGHAIGENLQHLEALKKVEGSIYHMLGEDICRRFSGD